MISFASQSRQALVNIASAKLRSFLAILGVMVGTGSVVALVISGQLATNKALLQFKSLGTDLLAVNIIDISRSKQKSTLPGVNDWLSFKDTHESIIELTPYINSFGNIFYQGHKISGAVIATDESLMQTTRVSLAQGDFVSFSHGFEKYCVLGWELASEIRGFTSKPLIGQKITANQQSYTIIGIANMWKENTFFNGNVNKSLIIPISVIPLFDDSKITMLIARLAKDTDVDTVVSEITQFVNRHTPSAKVNTRSPKQFIESMKAQGQTLTMLLGVIGAISLLVGGIGVMNVMLVSVVERKKEIGVRKAIGAKARDIWQLFLIESMVLSLLGGVLGVILGYLSAYAISVASDWPFVWYLKPPLLGFIVSASVGVFFGFYPALRASKLDPILSLRAD